MRRLGATIGDAVMAVLVLLRGLGQGAFLQRETFACVASVMSRRSRGSRGGWRQKCDEHGLPLRRSRQTGRLWRDVLEFGAMRGTLVGAGSLPFRTTWLQR